MIMQLGGITVEDVQHYGRLAEMMELVLPKEKRLNNADLGFGAASSASGSDWVSNRIGFSTANKEKRVVFKPTLSGLLQGQSKWIPGFVLGQQGLQIQLELANASDSLTGPFHRLRFLFQFVSHHGRLGLR